MNGLRRLENWIEQWVEEPFVRLFAGRVLPQDVAQNLVRALEDGERVGADGVLEVPGRYRIELHPDDLAALRHHHPDLEAQLAAALHSLAERRHVRLIEPPSVQLYANESLPLRGMLIRPADRLPRQTEATRDFDLERLQGLVNESQPTVRAYLILPGGQTFDLEQATVRIGRALDNDLILEDRRVSRHHARIHSRYGRYVLQDLGSRGGIGVNGFRVQESVLRPSDMISLAGVELIYIEEPVEASRG